MPSKLEALGARLDTVTRAGLGDTISYTASGETVPATLLGLVEFPDEQFAAGNGAATSQAITVELAIADVPIKPDDGARLIFPTLMPNRIWRPVSVKRSDAGDSWTMGVKEIKP